MNPVIGLSLGRIAVGSVALANPTYAARALRLDPDTNPQVPFTLRLFGSREVVLGLVTLASRGRARRGLLGLGVLVDAADAATGYLALQDGSVSRSTAASLAGPAIGAVGVGVAGLLRRS